MAINLKMDKDVEKATDSVGGGGVLDTDIYGMTIKAIYLGNAESGAVSATILATMKDSTDFK